MTKSNRCHGQLIVTSEELSSCKNELELQFSGKKLDKKDFFCSSDPFMTISKANETGKFTVVHRTEHINNNVNPVWKPFVVPVRTLCNGDLDRNLKFEVFDHNKSGNHSYIGEFYVTARSLMEQKDATYTCINPKKKVHEYLLSVHLKVGIIIAYEHSLLILPHKNLRRCSIAFGGFIAWYECNCN